MIPFDEVREKLVRQGCDYREQRMFANDEDCRLGVFERNGQRAILRTIPGRPIPRNEVRSICNRLGIDPRLAGFALDENTLN